MRARIRHLKAFCQSSVCIHIQYVLVRRRREVVVERVRLGIIGCGNMGRYHGRLFTQTVPEAEICALADSDPNNLARFIADVFPVGTGFVGWC